MAYKSTKCVAYVVMHTVQDQTITVVFKLPAKPECCCKNTDIKNSFCKLCPIRLQINYCSLPLNFRIKYCSVVAFKLFVLFIDFE